MKSNGITAGSINNGIAKWQDSMRAVVFDGVNAADIKQIVQRLVDNAKAGDERAIKMVFDYILGGVGPQMVSQTLVLNGPPTDAKPGTKEKLKVMQARAARGESVSHDDDAGF